MGIESDWFFNGLGDIHEPWCKDRGKVMIYPHTCQRPIGVLPEGVKSTWWRFGHEHEVMEGEWRYNQHIQVEFPQFLRSECCHAQIFLVYDMLPDLWYIGCCYCKREIGAVTGENRWNISENELLPVYP